MRRHRLEAYLRKVFDWDRQVAKLPEGRQHPQHPWAKVFDAVLLASAGQIGSLHSMEAECRRGVLRQRIGPLSEDTLGYAMQKQDPQDLFRLGCQVARRLKRNGVLRSDWARGRVVAAVDGIEICSSYVRCCPACLQRNVERKVDHQLVPTIQYYHKLSAVMVVSTPFPIFLGIRFQKPGEGEVACSLALLQDLQLHLGRRFIDVLVADALYLQSPFIQSLEALGWSWVFNLKDNQPELVAATERLTQRPADEQYQDKQSTLQLWHQPKVYWPVADRDLRVLKTLRHQSVSRQVVHNQQGEIIAKEKQVSLEVSTNCYATNFELGSIPPFFIHQLARSRWSIDTQGFQTITTNCHLKLPSVHRSTALIVLTMIRILAYTLSMVFFVRQVCSHYPSSHLSFSESARLIRYGFLAPRVDTS